MIRSKGRLISYVTVTPGVYSTSTSRATVTKTAKDVRAITKIKRGVDQNNAPLNEMWATVSPLDVASPTKGDRIEVDNEEWVVADFTPIYFEDATVTFKIHARLT